MRKKVRETDLKVVRLSFPAGETAVKLVIDGEDVEVAVSGGAAAAVDVRGAAPFDVPLRAGDTLTAPARGPRRVVRRRPPG